MSLRGIITYIMDLFGKDDEKVGLFLSEIRLKHIKVNSKGSKQIIYGNGFLFKEHAHNSI